MTWDHARSTALITALNEAGIDARENIDLGPTLIDVYVGEQHVLLTNDFNREDGGWEAQVDNEGDTYALEDGPLQSAPVAEVVAWVQGHIDAGLKEF